MRRVFDHEKLKVYQDAVGFCAWVQPVVEALPARLSARDQLERASTSVALNIAEGNGKRSHPDRCRFLDIARGSALECAACLDVLAARGSLTIEKAEDGKGRLAEIVSMIAGLIVHFEGRPAGGEKEKD